MYLRKNRRAEGILVSCFLFVAFHSAAQGMYGFEGGLGKSTTARAYTTPAFSGYYLSKLSRTFYLGAALNYERYSFLNNYNPVSPSYGDIISIRQKSSYVILSPKLDVGIGYRKYWHVFASFGAGMLLSGNQVTNKYDHYSTLPPVYTANDTVSHYTSYDLPVLLSRYSFGVARRISTGGYWNIMLSAAYSYIPTNLTTHGPALRTNYFAFTIGIMHKYPMVLVEY